MINLEDISAKFSSLKDPFEKADFLLKLEEKGINFRELAKKLRINVSYLSHYKRLKKLPEIIIDGYYSNSISLSHLFIISRLKNENEMVKLYEKILKNNLGVKDTEMEVRRILYEIDDSYKERYYSSYKTDLIKSLFKRLIHKGVQVNIIQTRTKVKIEILGKGNLRSTNNLLDRILNLLRQLNGKEK